ncbi:MAG: class I tRNA ligase family protein [Puniceicoccales bacterium]|jgi:methionyl-tRNA synthetase|nr:class I tRNA ligase family protein [Puniceicoccales bacterium]
MMGNVSFGMERRESSRSDSIGPERKVFYLTTAIDYANGPPHLGHAYEKVLADVVARYRRLKGEAVHFLTGLDEHGQKVQQKAQTEGLSPVLYCDQIAQQFARLLADLNITNDDYLRTTEERHREYVRKSLQALWDQGCIYKGTYTGAYSVKEERFLQDKDQVEGRWPDIYGEVKSLTEPNYFFRLSSYQDWWVDFLTRNPTFIYPSFRQKQVMEFLKEPLNDLCLSRPKERLSWGIPLPFDENFVTYVWLDALLNYVSAVDESSLWPADLQIIGKDILVPAHAVYWPILLKALGRPMPRMILVHGWWLARGNKLSKSLGNTVDPFQWIRDYGSDACRYFFMREMVTGQDSEFSTEVFESRYNADLANEWGNLVNRTLSMVHRYCRGTWPEDLVEEEWERDLAHKWSSVGPEILECFDRYQFPIGLEKLFSFVRELNRYVDQRAPWRLSKSSEDRVRLNSTLLALAEGIRLVALVLYPIMPVKSEHILASLGSEPVSRWSEALNWNPRNLCGRSASLPVPLFPKKITMPQNAF